MTLTIVNKFVLSEEDKLLLVLRDELYGGSWETFTTDLNKKLIKRPYIFRMANRIEEDIERIKRLVQYETKHPEVNLYDLIKDD